MKREQRRLRICLVDRDRAQGTPSTSCVIAQAARRQFKTTKVFVGYSFCEIDGVVYNLDAAGQTIAAMSPGYWHTVKPQTLVLTVR